MSRKSMTIAFPAGGKIPAGVLNQKTDLTVDPHKPVKVPDSYGRQMVENRFAYEPDAKSKKEREAEATAEKRAEEARVEQERADERERLVKAVADSEAALKIAPEGEARVAAEKDHEGAKAALEAFDADA